MKRYYCDKCGKQIDIDHDGFTEMRVTWWVRGGANAERLEYKPDYRHREGNESYMMCAECTNEVFGKLEGMEDA